MTSVWCMTQTFRTRTCTGSIRTMESQSTLPLNRNSFDTDGLINHHRLLLRVSFKLANGKFVALTFVCDTGAPDGLYLSPEADKILADGGRRMEDEAGNTYMDILGKPAATRDTPRTTHQPANMIGLSLRERLGLSLEEDGGFSFQQKFDFF